MLITITAHSARLTDNKVTAIIKTMNDTERTLIIDRRNASTWFCWVKSADGNGPTIGAVSSLNQGLNAAARAGFECTHWQYADSAVRMKV